MSYPNNDNDNDEDYFYADDTRYKRIKPSFLEKDERSPRDKTQMALVAIVIILSIAVVILTIKIM